MPARSTLALFLSKVAHRIDKFGYDEVVYTNNNTKVKILCKTHNEYFMMRPSDHLSGQGCPICREDNRGKKRRLPQDIFEEKGHAAHNHAYDYSKAVYVNSTTKITIICKKHGEFTQGASSHLAGHGCPQCGLDAIRGETPFDKKDWRDKYRQKAKENNKKRYEEKKEEILRQCKAYREKNKGAVRASCRSWYDRNTDRAKATARKSARRPARFERYGHLLTIDDKPENAEGLLTVVCKKCGIRFTPTAMQCNSRISATRKLNSGESNFYCGDACKNSCDIYRAIKVPNGQRLKSRGRECQQTLRTALKSLQVDEIGSTYCEKCGDIIEVDMHHTLPLEKYEESGNVAASLLLICKKCHIKMHQECR